MSSGKIVRRNKLGQFYQKDERGRFAEKEPTRGERGPFDDPGTPTAALLRRTRGDAEREVLPPAAPRYEVIGP